MKEHPILFSAPMVRAILSGQKTQTRRIMRRPPSADLWPGAVGLDSNRMSEWIGETVTGDEWRSRCEVADIGGVLWVRENAYITPPDFGDADQCNATDKEGRPRLVGYSASMDGDSKRHAEDFGVKQTPSIHMPRWACRLILTVTDVRPQRLHDITEEDALAEGVERFYDLFDGAPRKNEVQVFGTARDALADLWADTYGRASWDANPWVWVVSFRRVV